MYKRDYHPDENIVFDTKNYGFTSPKSTGLEPLSNALVQIDAALKKEETERIEEDVRINGRVDKEITDRKAEDVRIDARVSKEITDRENADENILNVTLKKSNYNIMAAFNNYDKEIYPAYQIGNVIYSIAWLYQGKTSAGTFTIWIPKNAQNVHGLNSTFFSDSNKNVKVFLWTRNPEKDIDNYIAYSTETIPALNTVPAPCTAQIITFRV